MSYENWKEEFKSYNLFLLMRHIVSLIHDVEPSEIMALRSAFLETALLKSDTPEDERKSAFTMAEALDEIIIAMLVGNDAAVENYLEARSAEISYLNEFGIGTLAHALVNKG